MQQLHAFVRRMRVVADGASWAAVRSLCACFAAASGAPPERTVGPVGHLLPGQPGEVSTSADGVARSEMHGHTAAANVPSIFFVPVGPVSIGGKRWRPAEIVGSDSFSVTPQPSAGIVFLWATQSGRRPPQFTQSLCIPGTLWWYRNSPGVPQVASGKTAGSGRSPGSSRALGSESG